MAIKYPESKGIRGGVWKPNGIFRDADINFVNEAAYTNFVSMALSRAKQDVLDGGSDVVLEGLELTIDTLLTTKLSPGMALSATGEYLVSGAWAFSASVGSVFGVVAPVETSIGFTTADPTNPRIDTVEIRPVQTEYDQKPRNFKDPVTGVVTTSSVNTKVEYGFEFAVRQGTPGASPSAQATTAGWIKLAEVTVPATATSLVASNIKTYKDSAGWSTDSNGTVDNDNLTYLTENVTVDLFVADDLTSAQTKIDAIPRNLSGNTLTIRFETGAGSHTYFSSSSGTSLTLDGFHGGTVLMVSDDEGSTSATLTFEGYAGLRIVNCSAWINCSSWLVFNKGNGYAYAGQDHFVMVTGCTNVEILSNITNTATMDSGIDVLRFDRCAQVSMSGVTLTSGSADRALYVVESKLDNLPILSGTPTYYIQITSSEVRDSTNLGTGSSGSIDPASSKYLLLDRAAVLSRVQYRRLVANWPKQTIFTLQYDAQTTTTPSSFAWQNNCDTYTPPTFVTQSGSQFKIDGGGMWMAYAYSGGISLRGPNGLTGALISGDAGGDFPRSFHFSDDGQYGVIFIYSLAANRLTYTSNYGTTWTTVAAVTGTTTTIRPGTIIYRNGRYYMINTSNQVVYASATNPTNITILTSTPTMAVSGHLIRMNGEVFMVTASGTTVSWYRLTNDTTASSLLASATASFTVADVGRYGSYIPSGSDAGYYVGIGTSNGSNLALAKLSTDFSTATVVSSPLNFQAVEMFRDPISGCGVGMSKWSGGAYDSPLGNGSEPNTIMYPLEYFREDLLTATTDGTYLSMELSRDTSGETTPAVMVYEYNDSKTAGATTQWRNCVWVVNNAFIDLKEGNIQLDS